MDCSPALLLAAAGPRQQGLDLRHQLQRVERLDDVVVGAGAQAPDPLFHLRLGGEHDDRHPAPVLLRGPDLLRGGVAVELRHGDVHEDEVGRLRARHLQAGGAVGCDEDLVALLLEGEDEDALDVQVVIDDEDLVGSHACSAGSRCLG